MNKEQAEVYASLESLLIVTKGFQYKFLLVNLAILAISLALYQGLIFIASISLLTLFYLILTFLLVRRAHIINRLILLIIQLIILCFTLNFLLFGLYQFNDMFILWEFLLSIVIQVFSFLVSFLIIKKIFEKAKEKEANTKTQVWAGVVAGFFYSLILILLRILAPTVQTGILAAAIIINVIVCLFSLSIVAGIYRVYVTKKFNLECILHKEESPSLNSMSNNLSFGMEASKELVPEELEKESEK